MYEQSTNTTAAAAARFDGRFVSIESLCTDLI